MKIIAINGSPRKKGNTVTLLQKVLDGAKSQGAETELINLYDLKFKGCTSCFFCKMKGQAHGKCAMKDDLTPILEQIKHADAIAFGTPIYFMQMTSGMTALLERLLFSNFLYKGHQTVFPKKIQSGIIYTMNITKEEMENYELKNVLKPKEMFITNILGDAPKILYSQNTYQFKDYSKYEVDENIVEIKTKQKAEQFPIDCENSFCMGVNFVKDFVQ